MSTVMRKARRLERYRAVVKTKKVTETPGKGKAGAREAKKLNIQTEVARKKISGKAARDFDALGVDELKNTLAETRKELFNLRFKHATGQLENVASLSTMRRRIARILTLIKQKEVGA